MASTVIPELEKAGYDKGMASGAIAASGGLAAIIPPSVFVIIYAVLIDQSAGEMFIAILGLLDVLSGYNVRELGGYPTPYGQTLYHRFVRSGDTDGLSSTDIAALRDYGVSMDVDLRSQWEVTHAPDRLAKDRGVRSLHAQLHSYDTKVVP